MEVAKKLRKTLNVYTVCIFFAESEILNLYILVWGTSDFTRNACTMREEHLKYPSIICLLIFIQPGATGFCHRVAPN